MGTPTGYSEGSMMNELTTYHRTNSRSIQFNQLTVDSELYQVTNIKSQYL
jgi:hypothetical protein